MKLEKINFNDNTYVWKTKLKLHLFKDKFLEKSFEIINSNDINNDAYHYPHFFKNELNKSKWTSSEDGVVMILNPMDNIIQSSIDLCKEIYVGENNSFTKINLEVWINRVCSKTPNQKQFYAENKDDRFHTHTGIAKARGFFYPHYTWIYYIQMPEIIKNNDDGVLYVKDVITNKDYSILPEEDDLIIIPGHLPHLPMNAPDAILDRIVLAGNVGFENIKTTKSIC